MMRRVRRSASASPLATATAGAGAGDAVSVVAVVTAHPDDESMFFAPLLRKLCAEQREGRGGEVWLLCLSSGDAEGLGRTRVAEVRDAGRFLGLRPECVVVMEHEELQDGMDTHWPTDVVAEIVRAFVRKHGVNLLVTFDDYGVSGHPNHIAVSRGVCAAVEQMAAAAGGGGADTDAGANAAPDLEEVVPRVHMLESMNLLRKFSGLVDVAVSLACGCCDPDVVHTTLNWEPWTVHQAMLLHRSQFVWYRRLFVLFSRYSYINTFKQLRVPHSSAAKDGDDDV